MYRVALSSLHEFSIGDLYLILSAYKISKHESKSLYLYIDDLNIDEGDFELITHIIKKFSLDSIVFSFKEQNLKFYQQFVTKLLMDKSAYNCFCDDPDQPTCKNRCKYLSDFEVLDNQKPFSIRLNLTDDGSGDPLLLNSQKIPTNIYSSAINDILYDISYIVDKKDKAKEFEFEQKIRDRLGYKKEISPIFLSVDEENRVSIKSLLDEGYLIEAIFNYLNSQREDKFLFERAKLNSINKEEINSLDPLTLSTYIGYSSKDIGEVAKLFTKNSDTINQIKSKIDIIFSKKDPKDLQKEFDTIKDLIKDSQYFDSYDEFLEYLIEKSDLKKIEIEELFSKIFELKSEKIHFKDLYIYLKNYLGEIIK